MRIAPFLPGLLLLAACTSDPAATATPSDATDPSEDEEAVESLRQIPDSWVVVLLPEGLVGTLINSGGLVAGRREGKNVLFNYHNGRQWSLPDGSMIAVNDRDEVLINRDDRAYLWSKERTLNLGSLAGGATAAVDLNNAGHVAGMSGSTPFIWTPARGMRPLRGKGAPNSISAMNGRDQIVGVVGTDNAATIVVWSPDGSTRKVRDALANACPPWFPDPTGSCILVLLGLDNRGVVGGLVGQTADNTAGFVINRKGELEAFNGIGRPTIPTGYTDSGIMPMLSFSSTTPSVRLPDGRIRPLFHELGGFSYAFAASVDGHILGAGDKFDGLGYRYMVLVPQIPH